MATFINECNKAYENTWMIKVKDLLSRHIPAPVELSSLERKKRGLSDVITYTAVSNFIKTVVDYVNPWSDYNRINRMEDVLQH